jgi:hypothetical protein
MEVEAKSNPPALTLEERAVQALKKAAAVGNEATAGQSGGDISEKCKQYISKMKAKAVEDIKTRLGKELLTYDAISNGNCGDQLLPKNYVRSYLLSCTHACISSNAPLSTFTVFNFT